MSSSCCVSREGREKQAESSARTRAIVAPFEPGPAGNRRVKERCSEKPLPPPGGMLPVLLRVG